MNDDRQRYAIHAAVFAALANPTRHELMHHLCEAPRTPSELAELLDVSRPNVSQHLAVLRHVGPADVEQFGQLTGRARRVAEVMHELVSRRVRERGEHRGVDGVSLAVIVHEAIIAKFRNFATWQSLEQ